MPDSNLDRDRQPAGPIGDPRMAAIATRLRRIRVDLDRIDDQLDLLADLERAGLIGWAHVMRDALDQFEQDVEKIGAGLTRQPTGDPLFDSPEWARLTELSGALLGLYDRLDDGTNLHMHSVPNELVTLARRVIYGESA